MAKNSKAVQKRDNEKRAGTRTRNWTCVIYPESVPENWREIIEEFHIPWVESPLHDRDVDANGEPKKPHWHILFMFDGNKTFEQVKEITDRLNGPIPQKCNSAKAMVRYMAHFDNPEKAQYNKADIIGHGGVDLPEMLRPTSSNRYQLIAEMMDYIGEQDITEMEDLLIYARKERFDDWFPLLCDNSAYIMGSFVKSRRHRTEQPVKYIKVNENGEVIN